MDINIRSFAFSDADADVYQQGWQQLGKAFPELKISYTDDAQVLHFITGGSEADAVAVMRPGNMYVLLAGAEGNSWAAATEVKAWASCNDIPAILVSMDDDKDVLRQFGTVSNAFKMLQGKRAGLIGEVSHWLVASAFPFDLAKERFGFEIQEYPWSELPDWLSFDPDSSFLATFGVNNTGKIEKEARIYAFLRHVLSEKQLDALTLECFTMVKQKDVTACLALAMLNDEGVVAACEGDLVSLAGMMLVQALTGKAPWMANVASLSDDQVLLAHCTAPLDSLSGFSINTHFETDRSAAVQGKVFGNEVTVFRLGMGLDKAFIASGNIVSRPQHTFACRTQVEVSLPTDDIEKLRHAPLGNHHLIIPGDCTQLLRMACRYKGIQLV